MTDNADWAKQMLAHANKPWTALSVDSLQKYLAETANRLAALYAAQPPQDERGQPVALTDEQIEDVYRHAQWDWGGKGDVDAFFLKFARKIERWVLAAPAPEPECWCNGSRRCGQSCHPDNEGAPTHERAAPAPEPVLPYDVTVGGGTFRKGVRLSTFVLAAQGWHRAAFPDGYTLTDEQKAENLRRLQDCASPSQPVEAEGVTIAWASCQTRGPWVRNSLNTSMEALLSDEKRIRHAYRKPFMAEPCAFIADAYAEAAEVFKRRLAPLSGSAESKGDGNGLR